MNEAPEAAGECRYFLSYTGVALPFRLITPLTAADVENRNTYFKGWYDADGRLTGFDKMVYGEIELAHRYAYHASGRISRVEITDLDEERTVIDYPDAAA